jgi:hypothetical protein
MEWGLLSEVGFYGLIKPSMNIGEVYVPFTKFPEWMGKFMS